MHTVFKFDIAIFTNTSKYNLAEGQNLNKLNKDIWYVAHTHTLDLLYQIKTCISIYNTYVLHFIYLHMYIKK